MSGNSSDELEGVTMVVATKQHRWVVRLHVRGLLRAVVVRGGPRDSFDQVLDTAVAEVRRRQARTVAVA